MTNEPPASSEGSSLPQRHRPSLGDLAKDTTEADLWDLDDDLQMPGEERETPAGDAARSAGQVIPSPREPRPVKKSLAEEGRSPAKVTGGEEQIRMHVNKTRAKSRPSDSAPHLPKAESEFDDLENWEDVKLVPGMEALPAEGIPETETITPEPEAGPVSEERRSAQAAPEVAAVTPEKKAADDEFSPLPREDAAPVSLRPNLRLSKIERIGLIGLLLILVGGGFSVFFSSLNRLTVEELKAEAADFPIKGNRVTIVSARSYWRAPIREGPDADTFRRGTELLPVLELAVSGGPAAIRVFFHDEDGRTVGDVMTRRIDGKATLEIPATAGFDDPGMHAAYRTGESKPWTIEVREILSGDSADAESTKLFKMNISTDRH